MYDNLVRELQCCPDGEYGCSRCEHRTSLHCRETLMKQAAKAIEELQQMVDASIPKSDAEIIISEVAKAQPKWIPVTERLPENRHDVLVYAGVMFPYITVGYYDGLWKSSFNDEEIAGSADYWMPLTEPPKEVDE